MPDKDKNKINEHLRKILENPASDRAGFKLRAEFRPYNEMDSYPEERARSITREDPEHELTILKRLSEFAMQNQTEDTYQYARSSAKIADKKSIKSAPQKLDDLKDSLNKLLTVEITPKDKDYKQHVASALSGLEMIIKCYTGHLPPSLADKAGLKDSKEYNNPTFDKKDQAPIKDMGQGYSDILLKTLDSLKNRN